MNPVLSIIVPLYNEEEVISETYKRLTNVMTELGLSYEILFIDDGSRDKTAQMVKELSKNNNSIQLISFSRNFGHQAAITAGIDMASGEAAVIIDADLQDPPEIIPGMVSLWKQGYDVVYGKRISRKGETLIKKLTAKMYYRVLKNMTNCDIPVDTGDFRLIDRKVIDVMKNLRERTKYIRGLVSWVGFKQIAIEYMRDERFAGETKYSYKKMFLLALNGITSFSYQPLRIATFLGFIMAVFSFLYLVVVLYQKISGVATVSGWTSTIAVILLTQGIVLIVLGIMGEYIGRIFEESKSRPLYIVNETVSNDDNDK